MLSLSTVQFLKDEHEYWLNGKKLSGITGMIERHICPDRYKGIPEHILEQAREKGSLVHEEIETYINTGENGFTDEFSALKKSKFLEQYKTLSPEYLVSDNEYFATLIDLVAIDEKGFIDLIDWKTIYRLDKTFLMWQLSICAYLFELQTGFKVKNLKAVWLRPDKCEIVDIPRLPNCKVLELMGAEIKGEKYGEKTLSGVETELQQAMKFQALIEDMKARLKIAQTQYDEITSKIKERMCEKQLKQVKIDKMSITYVAPTTRISIDSKKLKEECPELYEKYSKTSEVKDSIRIKIVES